jgi:PIN domain nuclease of toxin-antitoxin system
VKLLLDTNVLLWVTIWPDRLSAKARQIIGSPDSVLMFSVISIWKVAIKKALQRDDFTVDPTVLRDGLLQSGHSELPITGLHAAGVADLPSIHRDPFDRLLVAQTLVERMTLLTADPVVARYPAPVRLV